MASTSAVSMSMVPSAALTKTKLPSSEAFFRPLPVRSSKPLAAASRGSRLQVQASLKEKLVSGFTAGALTASMIIPDVAQAAVSPSLKNLLLSVAAGGTVLVGIIGVVVAVSNFDPVKRT